ncbi:FAD-dependent oxidoreductase [Sphingosinicella microcystinivorans]|uniref:Ferredoxin--NADP+ reductase n=1 Tax=Sphingosinicella microcystinivorans TaxID=335406 RepID=A0AAD1D302_SPHMI|nr:FAD-dependent oxidoreductase [Sphingosinicella microcystinivorans]RKS88890.1 ferredoxin--NADP+ reductase [Sphingosinicella microcystinivorans]BBE32645.1 NADP oxidoreductase [Sphingosinicella microcystinivorans]
MTLQLAIVGSGPAGYYTAEAAQKLNGGDVRIDIIDRLPTPFGLIRAGVAPDHQSIKAVSRRYEKTALSDNVRFVGNVPVGDGGISVDELLGLYDAVVLATGAPTDRPLGIPGEDLPGVLGSAAFVGWYNGHPDFVDLAPPLGSDAVVVIGNGNVAIDCARILAKLPEEFEGADIVQHAVDALGTSQVKLIRIVGRRGPHQVSFTPKEVGEMGELARASPVVDPAAFPPVEEDEALEPGLRKVVATLRAFAATAPDPDKPVRVYFDYFLRPVEVLGEGRVEALRLERTRLVEGRAEGTGEMIDIPCGMVVSCIGYRTLPISGVPYDDRGGRFVNQDGRIAPGLYCVGWARRGPTGTIGTNRPDGFAIADLIASDITPSDKAGRTGLDALAAEKGIDIVTFREWQKIDAAEVARARGGAPREKFVVVDDMMTAARS